MLECPICNGRGDCDECDDGQWGLTGCPARFVDEEIQRAMWLARFAKDGTWPVAGGTLDQTQWFLDFCGFYWAEQARQLSEVSNGGG